MMTNQEVINFVASELELHGALDYFIIVVMLA